jgi:hypothetical protein
MSLAEIDARPTTTISDAPRAGEWDVGIQTLRDSLNSGGGCVSSRALRQALEQKNVANPRELVVRLRYFDFNAPVEDAFPKPSFRWHCHGKSFYSEDRFAKIQQQQDVKAASAEQAVTAVEEPEEDDDSSPAAPTERRRSRQEERRLGTYVVSALENLYQSDYAPEDAPYVFDVHNDRAGNEFENVDVVASHWRSSRVVELISVEVKLEFTARLVQQARNYGRFSDRVWLAAPVLAEAADASTALRDFDPNLFEHVVDAGLGILACRRRPGRSYEIVPIHWPRRLNPDAVEKDLFLERYRKHFERAGVLAPRSGHRYPTFG